jgi:hypothetical protein
VQATYGCPQVTARSLQGRTCCNNYFQKGNNIRSSAAMQPSNYVAKDWKLGLKAYLWDSRSLLGERNTLDFSKNKTQQVSVTLSYVY